ncbi:hypothetical protein [Actinoplanes sp. NPDC051494]|uniref:hypothetical protein n=1 Tax=Actinoplanes sp. NPDC051494 TaxID=3363907 RepID=UPI00378B5E6E
MLVSRWRSPLVLVVVLGVAATLIWQRTTGPAPAPVEVDATGFAYVPAQRPPGLISMGPGSYATDLEAAIGSYHFEGGRLDAYVAFSPKAVPECAAWSVGSCARAERVEVAGVEQPLYVGVTVQPRGPEPSATESDITSLKRYWADVAFVPVEQAAWYQDALGA